MASSIDSLGKLLDYPHDIEGSAAVANAVLRRLEVLTAAPGVRVSVAGLVAYTGDQGPLHLLTDAPLALDDDVELRDGRLMVVKASRDHKVGRERRAWIDGDYTLLRIGAAEARRATTERPLAQRKVEHALAELNLGTTATRDAGGYSARNASARQAALAQEILDLATSDDQDRAAARWRCADPARRERPAGRERGHGGRYGPAVLVRAPGCRDGVCARLQRAPKPTPWPASSALGSTNGSTDCSSSSRG